MDESLPRKLAGVLSGFEVVTVNEAGWSGIENGELLRRASGHFEVFLTGDKNLRHQQNLAKVPLGIVVIGGYGTKLEDLLPLAPRLREGIEGVSAGELVIIEPE